MNLPYLHLNVLGGVLSLEDYFFLREPISQSILPEIVLQTGGPGNLPLIISISLIVLTELIIQRVLGALITDTENVLHF